MSAPKYFCKFIANKSKIKEFQLPMTHKERLLNNRESVCEAFNDNFFSVNSEAKLVNSNFVSNKCTPFCDIEISVDDLNAAFDKLNINKSADPDKFLRVFIKILVNLLLPLFILFNKSLTTGNFLSDWKHAHIATVFKSGNR